MKYFLNVIYAGVLLVLAPCLAYAAIRFGKYREGWRAKLLGFVPELADTPHRRVWFHAVSVGEVNLLGPILKQLLRADPHVEVVVTTTTKTGHALASQRFCDHTVCYCPLDFSWAVRNAFKRLKPDLLVLVELELWPNLLLRAQQESIPVAIVNGRLSDKSTRGYLRVRRWLPGLSNKILQCISIVGAQSRQCEERFIRIGIPQHRVVYTGSIKFDGAQTDRQNAQSQSLRQLANIRADQKVLVAGSTQAPEESYALAAFQALAPTYPELRLILVPRHPERSGEVAELLAASGVTWCRRTEIDEQHPMADQKVLLVDTVGELSGWWGCADIGFVGGSMGKRGGQNMLEPSGFGVATCFGPNTRNFRDVVEQLLSAEAAVVVEDADTMLEFVQRCLSDHEFSVKLGKRAQQVVLSQRGATAATIELLFRHFEPPHMRFPFQQTDTSTSRRSA